MHTSYHCSRSPIMMNSTNFEVPDFLDWIGEDLMFPLVMPVGYDDPQIDPNYTTDDLILVSSSGISNIDNSHEGTFGYGNGDSGIGSKGIREKVAFKTKSEIEVLDDGFKWRKYGKKMVKNSPNPRNYYKCSVESCPVKKRVERDKEDSRYVVTTYEGIHNHQCPQL